MRCGRSPPPSLCRFIRAGFDEIAITCRVGKGALRRAGLLARTAVRLCPRGPTPPLDRVGKAREVSAQYHQLRQATLPTLRRLHVIGARCREWARGLINTVAQGEAAPARRRRGASPSSP